MPIGVQKLDFQQNAWTSARGLSVDVVSVFRNTQKLNSTGALQFGAVSAHLFVAAERVEHRGENRGAGCIGGGADAVMHPLALAARWDYAGVAQVSEGPREVW